AVNAFVALIPVCALFTGATIIFVRRKSISSCLQLVGGAGLVAVILSHVFGGLRVFPRMVGDLSTALAIISICYPQPWLSRCFLSRIPDSRGECARERQTTAPEPAGGSQNLVVS